MATAEHATTAQTTDPTPAQSTPPAPRLQRGLALAGVIGGSIALAALLFAGGVAVGAALPDRGPVGVAVIGGHGSLEAPGMRGEARDHRPAPLGERRSD